MASPDSLELARVWLTKACSDLEAARLLIAREHKYLDIGSYHCQQAAEKALKAFLTAKEIPFPKTHSLEDVLALCVPANRDFARFQDHCEKLTPLVAEFRYPDGPDAPPLTQAQQVLQLADEVYVFCEQQLSGA